MGIVLGLMALVVGLDEAPITHLDWMARAQPGLADHTKSVGNLGGFRGRTSDQRVGLVDPEVVQGVGVLKLVNACRWRALKHRHFCTVGCQLSALSCQLLSSARH